MSLAQLRSFVAVVEENGFSAAARRLGISKSICSKHVSDLEAELGVQLVQRTTRRVAPTDLGVEYFDHCREVLTRLEDANAAVSSNAAEVQGRLRITAPLSFTETRMEAILVEFVAKYPKIRLDLHLSDHQEDLVAAGFDAAIRIGELTDSSLIARKIGEANLIVCAAPDYLATHGTPKHPDELSSHRCLVYSNLTSGGNWYFEKNGAKSRKGLRGLIRSNNGGFLRNAALSGLGIVMLPDFIVGEAVAVGGLIEVLTDYSKASHHVYVVYPQRRNLCASVRAFIAHVAQANVDHP